MKKWEERFPGFLLGVFIMSILVIILSPYSKNIESKKQINPKIIITIENDKFDTLYIYERKNIK